jgi:undecaprenyl-diphosphatase
MFFKNLLKSLLFGAVEGITEWLPVSSTGHLILLDELVSLDVSEEFLEMFEVVIQLGAILAVAGIYFGRLNPFSRAKNRDEKFSVLSLWGKVIFAAVPSGMAGVLLDDWINRRFFNHVTVAAALIFYGILFILIERRGGEKSGIIKSASEITYKDVFFIGLFQTLSLVPGTSRSGATIIGGMLLGLSRSSAAEFSFFLAIPTMFGAASLKLVKFICTVGAGFSVSEVAILFSGSGAAFLVSLFAVKGLLKYVKRHSFSSFGAYRIALGLFVLFYFGILK